MVPIPPKYRSFISVPTGISAKSIAAPKGFSLVTSQIYTNICLFFDNVHGDPNFMHWQRIKTALEKTLNVYYPLTGRLTKTENGRYNINNFEKGALFEVVDSADHFDDYKKYNFSYSGVPMEELLSIPTYKSRDSPLLGIKLTYARCGSCVMGISLHHKVGDGCTFTQFLTMFAAFSRGAYVDTSALHLYTDKDRNPVQPLPGIDHSSLYPTYPAGQSPQPTIQMGPSRKVIFSFGKEVMKQLRYATLEEVDQPNAKVSLFNILSAFVHRAVVKSRRTADDSCADLICIVAAHHQHPDKKMNKPVPVPNTVKQVSEKSLFEISKEINDKTHSINVPFMESLEYYFNHAENVENIFGPIHGLGKGAVGFSDWSRFVNNFDFGFGHYIRLRSFVQTSPMAMITVMPFLSDTIEVIIQLDIKSLDRLIGDKEFMSYVKAIN
ncbi:transferase [Helicostylum pulchrum]|uniref:Uncharacterized protein n=1 Tax=Helicostylum pulchrum TaxID=562976 RepID=A0ABP9XWZ3_9FUNG|nr:transferase [Helicostylum pulchrum]